MFGSILPRLYLAIFFVSIAACTAERPPRHNGRRNLRAVQRIDEMHAVQRKLRAVQPQLHLDEVNAQVSTLDPVLSGWEPWAPDQKTKVIFGVFTSPLPKYAAQMKAVEDTWANRVHPQRLLVVGVNGTKPGITYASAPMCQDGHVSNPGISCKEATLLSTGHKLDADWVVVVGSDNYVFPKMMQKRLESEDSNKSQILGVFGCGSGQYCEDKLGGICGGAGYAISRAALREMVGEAPNAGEQFVQESMRTASTSCGYWSDQVTSCIARRHGVAQVDMDGLYGWRLCADDVFTCPFNEDAYREKMASTDPKTLTFHYIQPEEMRRIHEMAPEAALLEYDSQALIDGDRGAEVSLLDAGNGFDPKRSYASQRAAFVDAINQAEISTGFDHGRSYASQRAAFVERMNQAMDPARDSALK